MTTEPTACKTCPGQHTIKMTFTVCSDCDSTIALSDAIAQILCHMRGVAISINASDKPVSWSIRRVEYNQRESLAPAGYRRDGCLPDNPR
jgi:hypothetical protein